MEDNAYINLAIGGCIRRARWKARCELPEAAAAIGVTERLFRRYECGSARISVEATVVLAGRFRCRVDDFYEVAVEIVARKERLS